MYPASLKNGNMKMKFDMQDLHLCVLISGNRTFYSQNHIISSFTEYVLTLIQAKSGVRNEDPSDSHCQYSVLNS